MATATPTSGTMKPLPAPPAPPAPPPVPQVIDAAAEKASIMAEIQRLQGPIESAARNARVWEWGGSEEDQRHWSQTLSKLQLASQTQQRHLGIIDKLVAAGADQDPITASLFRKSIGGDSLAEQQLTERLDVVNQATYETKQREDLRSRMLAEIPVLSGQFGASLLNQEEFALNRLRPQIESALNSRGILQSGALPEALSKAFESLEMARQSRIGEFELGARAHAELGLPEQETLGNIELMRAALQRQFGQSDVAQQNAFQLEALNRQIEAEGGLANQQSRRARSRAMGSMMMMLAGAGIGGWGAAAAGGSALAGAGVGGGLGAVFGGSMGEFF